MHQTLQRLKERKLVQWALAYLAGAWFVWEALSMFADRWGISQSAQRSVDVALVVGLLVALVLAWYHGEKGRQRIGGVEVVILTLLAIGGASGIRLTSESDPRSGPTSLGETVSTQITFAGDVLNAVLSPDGDVVAFVAGEEGGAQQLFVQSLSGSSARLVHEGGYVFNPQWSPDNSFLAFGAGDVESQATYVVPRLGTTSPEEVAKEHVYAAWSSDASRLVQWSAKRNDLRILDLRTRSPTDSILLNLPLDWLLGVSWSPLRDQLALAIVSEGRDGLWTLTLGSNALTTVLEDSLRIRNPIWSHDGESVYYARAIDEMTTEVWRVEVRDDGTAASRPELAFGPLPMFVRFGIQPPFSLSSDDSQLLYVNQLSISNLVEFVVEGPSEVAIARKLTTGTASRVTPRLSPDAGHATFVQLSGRGSDLWTLDLADDSFDQLTFLDGNIWSPEWSADGTRIAFGSNHDGMSTIRVIDLSNGSNRPVGNVEYEHANHIAWGSFPGIAYQGRGDRTLQLVDPDEDSALPALIEEQGGLAYDPRPSPSGQWMAAALSSERSVFALWILSSDGTRRTKLGDHYAPIGWKKDESAVYALRGARGAKLVEVYEVPVSGGEPRLHTTLPLGVKPWEVAISLDGETILASVEEVRTDAWIVEATGRSR